MLRVVYQGFFIAHPKIFHNETYMLILRTSPPEHQAPLLVNQMMYRYNIELDIFWHTKPKTYSFWCIGGLF